MYQAQRHGHPVCWSVIVDENLYFLMWGPWGARPGWTAQWFQGQGFDELWQPSMETAMVLFEKFDDSESIKDAFRASIGEQS